MTKHIFLKKAKTSENKYWNFLHDTFKPKYKVILHI